MGYVITHWRGEQPLMRSFWMNGVALRVAVFGGLAFLTWAQPLPKAILLAAIALDLAALIWQSVGYFRATERNLAGSSSMIPLWGGMIAFLAAVAVMLSQWWGLILAANPPPMEELFSAKMDRLRAAQYDLTVDADEQMILFHGEITLGVTKRMADLLAQNADLRTVYLDSTGGNIFEARGVAKLVAAAGLDTHVDGQCSSACTIVFVAGTQRTSGPEARIGFHGYALLNAAKLPQFDVSAEQERDRASFMKQGVSETFLNRIYDSPNTSIWFPNRDELLRAGVLNGAP
ncbi:hypothetical protein MUY35_05445 [Aliiroseovarius sp. S1339]|uniref:COG3904 family protein n=1 Tax=Aliiroseovarius sp. S1339 TaxID=2936990 RepID=UPI0020BEC256|nr:hypothetical protein [Aliiroseovarius sp. S1339]MCK8463292.1 hypothetical protein [Aliiroseovarius sp. S1339]